MKQGKQVRNEGEPKVQAFSCSTQICPCAFVESNDINRLGAIATHLRINTGAASFT